MAQAQEFGTLLSRATCRLKLNNSNIFTCVLTLIKGCKCVIDSNQFILESDGILALTEICPGSGCSGCGESIEHSVLGIHILLIGQQSSLAHNLLIDLSPV